MGTKVNISRPATISYNISKVTCMLVFVFRASMIFGIRIKMTTSTRAVTLDIVKFMSVETVFSWGESSYISREIGFCTSIAAYFLSDEDLSANIVVVLRIKHNTLSLYELSSIITWVLLTPGNSFLRTFKLAILSN